MTKKRARQILRMLEDTMHEERACPDCGSVMRKTCAHGGKRRQDAWICPRAEAERTTDERGHIKTIAAAVHPWLRVWTAAELEG